MKIKNVTKKTWNGKTYFRGIVHFDKATVIGCRVEMTENGMVATPPAKKLYNGRTAVCIAFNDKNAMNAQAAEKLASYNAGCLSDKTYFVDLTGPCDVAMTVTVYPNGQAFLDKPHRIIAPKGNVFSLDLVKGDSTDDEIVNAILGYTNVTMIP